MEWLVLLSFVALAVLLVAAPGRRGRDGATADDRMLEQRQLLLAELRELDEDFAAGRIAAEDRRAGRRELAPRLRAVTETLRTRGDFDVQRELS
jgi:hypothetical protein